MNPPELPDFENERRFREALKFFNEAGNADGTLMEQLAKLPPMSYLMTYRLRWWQLILRPRRCLLALLTRKFDRRPGWQDRLNHRILLVEGFDDFRRLDLTKIFALRHLQFQGWLSAFCVFWACDAAASASHRGTVRNSHSLRLRAAIACARVICIITIAAVIGLLVAAGSALHTQGCLSCVSLGAALMAAQLAVVAAGLYVAAFYRPFSIRHVQDGLQNQFGLSP